MEKRLPRNTKEGLIYGFTICIITVVLMVLLNIGTEKGINRESIVLILKTVPIFIVLAMLIETFIIGRLSSKLVDYFTEPSDGFNSKILFNILFCVSGMSIVFTLIGTSLETGISQDLIIKFFNHWPRNFCVALWVEILLAQPVARKIMKIIHREKENSNE